jgi:hypothetical protein
MYGPCLTLVARPEIRRYFSRSQRSGGSRASPKPITKRSRGLSKRALSRAELQGVVMACDDFCRPGRAGLRSASRTGPRWDRSCWPMPVLRCSSYPFSLADESSAKSSHYKESTLRPSAMARSSVLPCMLRLAGYSFGYRRHRRSRASRGRGHTACNRCNCATVLTGRGSTYGPWPVRSKASDEFVRGLVRPQFIRSCHPDCTDLGTHSVS